MEPEEAIDTSAAPIARNGQDMPQDQAPAPPQMEGVPTGDDNSPGVPAPGQGDNGAIGEQQPQPQTKRFGPLARIASYLMGEGAVPPQVLQQAAKQIDPQDQMTPSDRNVMVVQDASSRAGPEAAWKIVQANRVAYNAKQAFAYAALNGNQQKPPDIHAAVDAANQAADHVLDGSNAKFMVSTGGQITATVKDAQGQTQVFDLSPDQFRKYLNVGGAGQWDRQMQGGIKATLTSLSAENQQQQRRAAVAQRGAAMAPKEDEARQGAQDPRTTREGQFRMTSPGEEQYDETLQRKAWGMYPGAGSSRERAEWLAQQEDKENQLQNRVDVAKETGENRIKAARETGRSRVETQESRNAGGLAQQQEKTRGWQYASDAKRAAAQITADQKAAHDGNVDARARIETARKAIATKRMTAGELSPEDKALEQQLTQQASQPRQQQASPQQAAPQQQAAPGAPPVQGARFYKGQWYTRGPNGEAVPYQQ